MKKILVINTGSSSLKFSLFEMPSEEVIASGIVERIGMEDAVFKYKNLNGKTEKSLSIKNHFAALRLVADQLLDKENGVLQSPDEIDAIGHRVVHGGSLFTDTTIITDEIKSKIKELFSLAPLHNPPNYTGIEVAESIFPNSKQVAVFDTAFHQSIPEKAHRYAIPNNLYEKDNVRLYGFHGTSHKYVSQKAAEYLGKPDAKIVILHLGNGCSATAVNAGKSIDHSLGFGPVTGLIMGTRSGDLDPAVVLYLIENKGHTAKEVNDILNKESGMLGLTGYSDLREIEARYMEGDQQCKLALEMNAYRIKKYIGAYAAAMNGLDAVVFTAGIGENSEIIRGMVCEDMDFLGIKINKEENDLRKPGIRELQTSDSQVKILVVPTNEEVEIARQAFDI
ncbi:MAG: acetate kinase [Cytophagaceae bacterium]|nr:acetate kinase [Cytophagaceae bacterium]